MRKLAGFDLNGWSDMAARNWRVSPGEDTDFGGPFEISGGMGSVVITLDEGSHDQKYLGGIQALMAPHGRGTGWGVVGKPDRRDQVLTLLEKPEDNIRRLAASIAALAPGGKFTGILSIDDTPDTRETAQEALLKALRMAGVRRGLLVWRPVLALLSMLKFDEVARASKVGVVSHCGLGFSTQTLRLRDDDIPTPERRRVGRLHTSGLGLRSLMDQACGTIVGALGNNQLREFLDIAQSPWVLALGKDCQSEVVRVNNGDWDFLTTADPIKLSDEPLPATVAEHFESCDVVLFETPASGAVAHKILVQLQAHVSVPVLAVQEHGIAKGALVAAKRLQQKQAIYFDFLPQISTIVQDRSGARNEDLIPEKARLRAGEVYHSQRPAKFLLQQGTSSLSVFLKKENVKCARKATINLPRPAQESVPVELSVEQSPASGRARLTLVSDGFSTPLVVDWDAAEELNEDWQAIITSQKPTMPKVLNRVVLPCGMYSWEDQPRTEGLSQILEQNLLEPRSINWRRLADGMSARPEGYYAISSEGDFPSELNSESKCNLDRAIDLAEADIQERLSGKGNAENHSLRFLTWLFHGCPQWIVGPMIDAMMQSNTNHPFRTSSGATTLLLQGIGRTASGSDEQRRAFDFLLSVPARKWNKNHLACASFLLSRNDSAPKLLSREDVKFLSGVAVARMRDSIGTDYTSRFIYAPYLLVGLLRWRLKEPQAMVVGSDPVADEMLTATELTIEDLSFRIGGQPRLKKYRKILRDVVKELNGQGTNPNLLLDLETLT